MMQNLYSADIARLAKPLFGNIYATRMKYIDTIGDDQLRQQGVFSNGHSAYDDAVRHQTVDNFSKISDMVHYYTHQIPFSLREPSDAKEIMELCTQYLKYWAYAIHDSIYPLQVPLTDLIALDALASKCYTLSYSPNTITSNPAVSMGGLFAVAAQIQGATQQTHSSGIVPYPSVMESISTGLGGGKHAVVE